MPFDFELPPLQEHVPTYELRIAEEHLAQFHQDPYGTPEKPATFVTPEGKTVAVEVRVRGGSSRHYPKKSWRVNFPDGLEFEGRSKVNFVSEQADRSLMAEKLGFDLLRAMGAPAPRAKYVRLVINGKYEGVYLDLERVDKDFTRVRKWADSAPIIYRCGKQNCEFKPLPQESWDNPKIWAGPNQWEKETNESEPPYDLRDFINRINFTPEPTFEQELAKYLDVEAYLRSMVSDALISNDIVMDSGSYVILDRTTKRWTYVPWDYNNAASRWWPTYGLGAKPWAARPVPVFTLYDGRVTFFAELRSREAQFSHLTHRVAANRVLRARFGEVLEEALERLFTPAILHPRIDAMHALIKPHVEQDPYVLMDTEGNPDPDGLKKFYESRQYVRDYVTGRAAFLKKALPALRAPVPRTLVLSKLDPAGGWVELRNDGSTPVSTEGMVFTTDLHRAVGVASNVPSMQLAPGESVRLTAAQLGLSLPSEGAAGLFDGVSRVGLKDALFYGPLPAGHYTRSTTTPDDWTVAK